MAGSIELTSREDAPAGLRYCRFCCRQFLYTQSLILCLRGADFVEPFLLRGIIGFDPFHKFVKV